MTLTHWQVGYNRFNETDKWDNAQSWKYCQNIVIILTKVISSTNRLINKLIE